MINEQDAIQEIRKHANANYNKGWDYIVECWGDGDILEALSENKMDLGKTIKYIQESVDMYVQKREEQRADVSDWGEVPSF
jgi:hypothetical protein